jgi:hypothetical protein
MSDTISFLQYPQRSILIDAQGYSRTTNMPFNTTRKTIYKGVDSTLGFDIKNQDRKPINLLGKTVMINFMQVRTGELLVQRRAELVKPEEGFCEFTIFSSDLVDTPPGIYQISAVVYDADGISRSLYTDHNRRATMEIELLDGAYPKFIPSIELSFTQLGSTWMSQPVRANTQSNDSSTLHTIQVSVTGFKGNVEALISLEYESGGNYFPIKFVNNEYLINFDGITDIQGWNFIGSARWVKILFTPDADNTGTVDKILYRS